MGTGSLSARISTSFIYGTRKETFSYPYKQKRGHPFLISAGFIRSSGPPYSPGAITKKHRGSICGSVNEVITKLKSIQVYPTTFTVSIQNEGSHKYLVIYPILDLHICTVSPKIWTLLQLHCYHDSVFIKNFTSAFRYPFESLLSSASR